jgi:hypothetical protein
MLDRKDVRATLDFDIHEALSAICDRDEIGINEFIEREIRRAVEAEVHRFILSERKFRNLGLIRTITDRAGKGH